MKSDNNHIMRPVSIEGLLPFVQKPARYTGGELNATVKEKSAVRTRFALCFPDLYEIGMSHLGCKIIYGLLNALEGCWCERAYAPAPDFEALMRGNAVPLYGLESLEPIGGFDIVGFSLQYEMSFPTILNMLDLAGIPILAKDRTSPFPLVIAGGPCVCNPEPLADFFDLFLPGEGEEVLPELVALVERAKAENLGKDELLRQAASIPGIYAPSLYDVTYKPDGTIEAIRPKDGAPARIAKRIVKDLDSVYFPESFVVPYIEIVHDRSVLEVLRGCLRGCRFCQAGFIYRPFREKEPETLNANARDLCGSTGYDEISLTSLSTSDYAKLGELLPDLLAWTEATRTGISLPSLRVDNFSPELLAQIAKVRKSGLTFAPEAGTQRLRDAINKNVTEDEIMRTCETAFAGGYTNVKLYFMLGLPTETEGDVTAIAELCQGIVDMFYRMPERPKGKAVNVSISAACFVPKPFTPFEFEPQDSLEAFMQKQKKLKAAIKSNKISFKYHESPVSFIEAVLARGDRRLGPALLRAWQKGAKLESWEEYFSLARWREAFAETGVDPAFYANRRREYDEVMPWSHLDYGVSREFLVRENKRAHEAKTSPNCREGCMNCGNQDCTLRRGGQPCK
jgi:radical SAM family uncharacterized protein